MARGPASRATAGLPGGFAPPSSNVTWCPNQFFDVALPHFPRGVVRLVGYLLWQTLAWNDASGRPRRHQQQLSWDALAARARVSRGALGEAIEAADAARLIARSEPDPSRQTAATYALRWSAAPYTREPAAFEGFFLGRGHRTYVPNQFFTIVIAQEPLAVARVVGAVIRYSIGFEAERGYRRTETALSCRRLARLTQLSERAVVDALQAALAAGYLRRVRSGRYGVNPVAARYGLHWSDGFEGPGTPASPARRAVSADAGRSSKTSVEAVQKGVRRQFKNFSGPLEEMKPLGNETTAKPASPAGASDGSDATRRRLREMGFAGKSIEALVQFPRERIERQIAWLEGRTATRSPLGLLRRAIEEDWPPPRTARRRTVSPAISVLVAPTLATPTEPTADERRAYVAWMRERLEALERTEPSRFQAFLEHRARLKASLRYVHHDRPDHGILRGWDSEAARIAHLQAFDRTLPDLEAWCQKNASAGRQCPAPSETRAAMKNSQIAT